ncbi:MAG TPA: hypothetical protein VIX89_04825 [Bryobacteraceae bacterium]
MNPRSWLLCALLSTSQLSAGSSFLQRSAGKYLITLRPPADGIYAQEETEIEFRIVDTSRDDPLTGSVPVIRAQIDVAIEMPSMPGMPAFHELAHPEGVPGDFGVHPTFAHGGDYVMRLSIAPPEDRAFQVEFPIGVQDASNARNRKHAPPRFSLELSASPKTPKPGEPAELRLIVRDREKPKDVFNQFERAHEEFMHLVIVRDDLREFAHEHPALGPDGVFAMSYQFKSAGEYRLFADVAPRNAGSQVLTAKLKVAGRTSAPAAFEPRPTTQEIDGLRIELKTQAVLAKRTTEVAFTVEPATGLQPYLGARAHLIAIHQGALTFVHAHPDESKSSDGNFVFHGRFPQPGHYRIWIQFKRNGQLVTGEFTLEAKDN